MASSTATRLKHGRECEKAVKPQVMKGVGLGTSCGALPATQSRENAMRTLRKPNRAVIAAFFLPLLMAAPAAAEIIPAVQQARGLPINQMQCAAIRQAVWVTAKRQGFCIRYYVSTAGGTGTRPVVFLQGDEEWACEDRTWTCRAHANDKPIDTDKLIRMADKFSKATHSAAIYLARPGMDGSSGSHGIRHTVFELKIVNAALDAIKRRDGLQGFHLAGQSGGAILVGGLLALRRDIGCAVPGAGRIAGIGVPNNRFFYDSAKAAPVIARNGARILVVDDPRDQTTLWKNDTIFFNQVLHAGGRVELFAVSANGEHHHGVVVYARPALAACMRGASHDEISTDLARVQERVLAAKAQTAVRVAR
jgi:hypothetical protein